MNKILASIIIFLVVVCGYQYKLITETNERISIANGIAKDAMAASLQQTLISIELLQIKNKEFVTGYLVEQAHTEYKNLKRYHESTQGNETVMLKRALNNYSKQFSGGGSGSGKSL